MTKQLSSTWKPINHRKMIFSRTHKFKQLSNREKLLFLQAFFTLGRMRAAILTLPFKHLTRTLAHQSSSENTVPFAPLTPQETEKALLVGKAISRAAHITPWESACLAQALTAQRMLQRQSLPGSFFLGVKKDGDLQKEMEAHAWSQCGEIIVTGGAGHESYTVISAFSWERQ